MIEQSNFGYQYLIAYILPYVGGGFIIYLRNILITY